MQRVPPSVKKVVPGAMFFDAMLPPREACSEVTAPIVASAVLERSDDDDGRSTGEANRREPATRE
jgi:hypothetical protein